MKNRCLIVDEMHSSIVDMLDSIGIEPDYKPEITRAEVLEQIHNYHGLIVRSKLRIDIELLQNASKLQFIGRAGAGLDLIDLDEVEKRNIQIFNAPEGNRDALAEHTIGLILALFNKMVTADREVRNLEWKREANRGYELFNKVVAVVGYGYMGKAVVKRLCGFGCKVLVYDKKPVKVEEENARSATMKEIFQHADLVSFHIPLDEENRGMVNEDYLAKFKKDIWLINTSRGEILPLEVLVKNLQNGKILGAGLDVLENEKFGTYSPEQKKYFEILKSRSNVVLTPHVGGWSFESYVRINEVLIKKIRDSGMFS